MYVSKVDAHSVNVMHRKHRKSSVYMWYYPAKEPKQTCPWQTTTSLDIVIDQQGKEIDTSPRLHDFRLGL